MEELEQLAPQLLLRMRWLAAKVGDNEDAVRVKSLCTAITTFSQVSEELRELVEAKRTKFQEAQSSVEEQMRELEVQEDELHTMRQGLLERELRLDEREHLIGQDRGELEDARQDIAEGSRKAIEKLSLTADKALADLVGSKDTLANSWKAQAESASRRAEYLEKELGVVKVGLAKAGSDLQEARTKTLLAEQALESSQRESRSLLDSANKALFGERARADRADRRAQEAETEKVKRMAEELGRLKARLEDLGTELATAALDKESLGSRVKDLEQQVESDEIKLAVMGSKILDYEGESEELRGDAEEKERRIRGLKEKIEELEKSKILLKTQMDEALRESKESQQESRKRARRDEAPSGSKTPSYSAWGDDVTSVTRFLRACKPSMDADGSCARQGILELLAGAAANQSSQDSLLDFFESAPCDQWFCFDQVVAAGYRGRGAEIEDTCYKHSEEKGRCTQIRNRNDEGITGLCYGEFVCRSRSYST